MKHRRIIGLIGCGALAATGFLLQGNLGLYLTLAALCIVIGGTLFATLISYRIERLVIIFKTLKNAQKGIVREPSEIVELLLDLSPKKREWKPRSFVGGARSRFCGTAIRPTRSGKSSTRRWPFSSSAGKSPSGC